MENQFLKSDNGDKLIEIKQICDPSSASREVAVNQLPTVRIKGQEPVTQCDRASKIVPQTQDNGTSYCPILIWRKCLMNLEIHSHHLLDSSLGTGQIGQIPRFLCLMKRFQPQKSHLKLEIIEYPMVPIPVLRKFLMNLGMHGCHLLDLSL